MGLRPIPRYSNGRTAGPASSARAADSSLFQPPRARPKAKRNGLPWGCAPYPNTRMVRQRDLPVRHAPPKTSLSDGACSPAPAESRTQMAEQWHLPEPHSIDRKAGLAISARATKNHCPREHITPEWQDFETYRFCTRRQKSFFQKIQALPAPALRTHSLPALFYH